MGRPYRAGDLVLFPFPRPLAWAVVERPVGPDSDRPSRFLEIRQFQHRGLKGRKNIARGVSPGKKQPPPPFVPPPPKAGEGGRGERDVR